MQTVESSGVIVYALPEGGHVFRIAAQPDAQPEDISTQLDALYGAGVDDGLNISPDGTWLVLSSERFDPNCDGWSCLAVLAADLSSADLVLNGGDVVHAEGFPAVAAVASQPLVVYALGNASHALDLWLTQRGADGWSESLLLTGDSPYEWNAQPAMSADGTHVVFDCADEPYGAEGTALCEVATDGTGFRVVMTPDGGWFALHHPDYAPDGSIVFEGQLYGEQIWRLAADAAAPELLSDVGNDNSPCVLADGRVASLWLERAGNDPGYHELKVMDADGSHATMLLTDVDVLDGGIGCGG